MDAVARNAESFFCCTIGGQPTTWPPDWTSSDAIEGLIQAAFYHGVTPLLRQRLRANAIWPDLPALFRDHIDSEYTTAVAQEMLRDRELTAVLDALAASGRRPLLIKGTPIAFGQYPAPALRPRADTDLMVRTSDREGVWAVLETMGYRRSSAVSGELVSHQFSAQTTDRYGIGHVLDVHWRVSNSQAFARSLSFEELAEQAIAIPALGKHARAPCPTHALLIACMHRAAHFHSPYYAGDTTYYGGDRLIWLYDIHLLASGTAPPEQERFASLAVDKRMRAICRDALLHAQRRFGTELSDALLARLKGPGPPEVSAGYLHPSRFRHFFDELRALPGWHDRLLLLKERAFPPPDYMLKKYAVVSPLWLPVLYLRRGIAGLLKHLQRPTA